MLILWKMSSIKWCASRTNKSCVLVFDGMKDYVEGGN
uniref:Uncharacterized protein n=1 Tax=Anguilla anguilla TaxID=7936 RepID=A0A0E9P6R3_ANGAN